jgi:hypothetical protein
MPLRVARSIITLREVQHLQEDLAELKALPDRVKDKRSLISEAIKVFTGNYKDRGEHTSAVYDRLVRCVELEIEAKWAEYLKRFREEQKRDDGQILAAWPDEEA